MSAARSMQSARAHDSYGCAYFQEVAMSTGVSITHLVHYKSAVGLESREGTIEQQQKQYTEYAKLAK